MQIETISTAMVGAALDAAELRHRVIAANIANAGTVGYVRQTVSFQAQMDAMSAPLRPEVVPALGAGGESMPVRLDQEAIDMAANSLQYQALLRSLSRHYSVMHSAVTEGKR